MKENAFTHYVRDEELYGLFKDAVAVIWLDKSFLEPLRFIVNAIDWSFERQSTLYDFF